MQTPVEELTKHIKCRAWEVARTYNLRYAPFMAVLFAVGVDIAQGAPVGIVDDSPNTFSALDHGDHRRAAQLIQGHVYYWAKKLGLKQAEVFRALGFVIQSVNETHRKLFET